jgi:hypothetical protein
MKGNDFRLANTRTRRDISEIWSELPAVANVDIDVPTIRVARGPRVRGQTTKSGLELAIIYSKRIEVHGHRAVANDDVANGRMKLSRAIRKGNSTSADRWIDSSSPLDEPGSVAGRHNPELVD